jgi:hypothetical protein
LKFKPLVTVLKGTRSKVIDPDIVTDDEVGGGEGGGGGGGGGGAGGCGAEGGVALPPPLQAGKATQSAANMIEAQTRDRNCISDSSFSLRKTRMEALSHSVVNE